MRLNLAARYDLAPAQRQIFEQHEFAGREVDGLAVTDCHPRGGIYFQIIDDNSRIFALVISAAERLDPGQQLFKSKRLYQVIVRASLKSGDSIFHCVFSSENENVRGVLPGAESAQEAQAVEPGQHEIQDDGVVFIRLSQPESFVAIPGDIHRVARLTQTAADRSLESRRVFDQQQMHKI